MQWKIRRVVKLMDWRTNGKKKKGSSIKIKRKTEGIKQIEYRKKEWTEERVKTI